jgi:hypothetical protein
MVVFVVGVELPQSLQDVKVLETVHVVEMEVEVFQQDFALVKASSFGDESEVNVDQYPWKYREIVNCLPVVVVVAACAHAWI